MTFAPVIGLLVLAHQGGWDEMLMVAAPIALFAGLLWLANRRAEAKVRDEAGGDGSAPSTPGESTEPDPPR